MSTDTTKAADADPVQPGYQVEIDCLIMCGEDNSRACVRKLVQMPIAPEAGGHHPLMVIADADGLRFCVRVERVAYNLPHGRFEITAKGRAETVEAFKGLLAHLGADGWTDVDVAYWSAM